MTRTKRDYPTEALAEILRHGLAEDLAKLLCDPWVKHQSVRACYVLLNAGIRTMDQLRAHMDRHGDHAILVLRNSGVGTDRLIKSRLRVLAEA